MGGLLGWRKTTARYPANPYKVLPLYLLLLCLFYIHVGEEAITKFNQGIASRYQRPRTPPDGTHVGDTTIDDDPNRDSVRRHV